MTKHSTILNCIILMSALLVCRSYATPQNMGKLDVRDVLIRADNAKYQRGVTKIVNEHPLSSGKSITTSYYYQNIKDEKYMYSETRLIDKNRMYVTKILERPDGKWELCPNAVILMPQEMVESTRSIYLEPKPVLGTVDDWIENGVGCIRVVIVKSLEQKGDRLYEFLIGKESGVIIARRMYNSDAKKTYEEQLQSMDMDCDAPLSIFDLPKNRKILFPDTLSGYVSAIRNNFDITDIPANKKIITK